MKYFYTNLIHTLAILLCCSPVFGQWDNAELDTVSQNQFRDFVTPKQSLVVDEGDNLHMVWTTNNDAGGQIYYNRRTPDGFFGTPVQVGTINNASAPVTALIPETGRPVVVYIQDLGAPTQREVMMSWFSGTAWETHQLTTNNIPEYSPTIAIDAAGRIHVAWAAQTATDVFKIFYGTVILSDLTVASEELTDSSLGGFGSGADPYISYSEETGVLIGYRGGDFGGYKIHLAQKAPGASSWSYEIMNTPNADDYTNAITVSNGSIHMLISGNDGWGIGGNGYYLNKKIGDVWSAAELVNIGSNAQVYSSLVIDENGKAHCVWEELSGNFILGNIHYSTNKNGIWESVNLLSTGDIHNANLAFNSQGDGFVFAEQEDIVTFDLDKVEAVLFGTKEPINSVFEKDDFENLVTVYPNPTDSKLFLQQIDNQSVVNHFQLFDLSGKLIFEAQIEGQNSVQIDRTTIQSGMYFYRIFEDKKLIGRGKIVLE